MCGLAGAIGVIDERITSAVMCMCDAQSHRGPDAAGYVERYISEGTNRGVALGHRRLSIIDLSQDANQPMRDPETENVIVFNGEIYNFGQIRQELEREGVRFRTRSDTEVVLAAYRQWSASCVTRFRGMFAVALWDQRRSELVLMRDRLGIKPIYYARTTAANGGALLFASELRALLKTELFPRKLNRQARDTFLWHGFVVGAPSIVEGIHLLEAGAIATIGVDGELRQERYWSLPQGAAPTATNTDALRDELHEAVRLRLIADVPLGVFLSGGVDSSAVAALAVKEGRGRIQTFNISFDESEFDESGYASAVASRLGTEHHDIRLTQAMFREGLSAALGSVDQPTFDAINSYYVSRAVREAGMTVALAGTGGDELFGGYRSFADIPRAQRWTKATRLIPEAVLLRAAAIAARLKTGRAGDIPPQTRWGKLPDALATRGDLLKLYQLSYALYTPAFLKELVVDASAEVEFGLSSQDRAALRKQIDGLPTWCGISRLELASFITQRLLRDTDCASMAVSLEARVPLLDHRVVEEADRLEPNVRYQPLGRKQLLRELAMPELDRSMFDRPKRGFVLPIERWARETLQEQISETLLDRSLCERIGLKVDCVARLWRAYVARAPGLYWSRIWAIYVLMWWCREQRVSL